MNRDDLQIVTAAWIVISGLTLMLVFCMGGCTYDDESQRDAGGDASADVVPGSRVPGPAFDGGAP